MIANRQTVQTVSEKVRQDAQSIFPAGTVQKLFSSAVDGFQDMRLLASDDIGYCSDIFVRIVAARLFDKSAKSMADGLGFLTSVFSTEAISQPELEVIIPLIFWSLDSKSSQVADAALDLLFAARTHSDPAELSAVLRSCLETCSTVSLIHLFGELQFTIADDARNIAIFTEIVGYVQHKSVEVSAACGGVLAMIWRSLSDHDRSTLFESLPQDQKDALSAILPVGFGNSLDFAAFTRLTSLDKVKICRRLLDRLRTGTVQSDGVLAALLHELSCQETDWPAMKVIVFALDSLLLRCSLEPPDLHRTLMAVTFFANRWQRKLVLLDGIAQAVDSIVFKLIEKMAPLQVFIALLEGMSHFRGPIPIDCFYCKCWVVASNHIAEALQPGDAATIVSMANEQLQGFGPDDVRGKLCNALAQTAGGKRSVKVEIEPGSKQLPSKMQADDQPMETKPPSGTARTASVQSKENEQKPRESTTEKKDCPKVPVTNPKHVADLKNRLQQLRRRINK
jgi:hypothetical protein